VKNKLKVFREDNIREMIEAAKESNLMKIESGEKQLDIESIKESEMPRVVSYKL
jgi:hypothetical protein